MLVSDFDFDLPEEQIAQKPPASRGDSRMLRLDRQTGAWHDARFSDFPAALREGDLLVVNDSRVIPARLFGVRAQRSDETTRATGRIEVLLTARHSEWEWTALVKPGRKLRIGDRIEFNGGGAALSAAIIASGERGERTLRFAPVYDFDHQLDTLGHMPLPPYIHRQDDAMDRERYQTVYARERGSAAAPTAGLHFTPQILDQIRTRGVEICSVTLHVGLGTFRPVTVETTEEIHLHAEHYEISEACADAVNRARADGRRIVAAGTTTVRTLEHCATLSPDGSLHPHSGSTGIFISPGYRFHLVDALLTNFHLPQSTLLMLVAAFAGREHALAAYRHAVEAGYSFFSYGDCMFIS